jgi:hypothetical protein
MRSRSAVFRPEEKLNAIHLSTLELLFEFHGNYPFYGGQKAIPELFLV